MINILKKIGAGGTKKIDEKMENFIRELEPKKGGGQEMESSVNFRTYK